jgi:hypothetical protein
MIKHFETGIKFEKRLTALDTLAYSMENRTEPIMRIEGTNKLAHVVWYKDRDNRSFRAISIFGDVGSRVNFPLNFLRLLRDKQYMVSAVAANDYISVSWD